MQPMKAARKPSKSKRRQQKAAHAVAQRTKRPVNVCTICMESVIGPALRTAERRLGRFMPCGHEQLCWDCAYNHAMRSSLYNDDHSPILNEKDLDEKVVRCPCCNSTATAFAECSPAGTALTVAALPFRDLSAQERSTLRREPPSAWGRPRAEPHYELSRGEVADAAAAQKGARRSAEEQAKHGTIVWEATFREEVARLIASTGLGAALARPPQVWALAHLALAGCKEGVPPEHRVQPVRQAPVLGRTFNPATQLVDVRQGEAAGGAGAAGRQPVVAAPALDKNGCMVHPEARVRGVTSGLWQSPGGRAISRCAAWPERAVRAEFLAFICHRLVDVGAAEPSLAPRCKHKVSPDFVAGVLG